MHAHARVGDTVAVHPVAALLDAWAASGREPGGAVCVVRDGEVVVDHVVGTTDGRTPWEPDTLVMTYSVAKPFAALTVLEAVAAGALGLDQRVAELWPAYGGHGKAATTVRHVLSHAAGLPRFPVAAADLAFDDRRRADRAAGGRRAGPRARDRRRGARADLRPPLRRAGAAPPPARTSPTGSPRIAAAHGWDLHLRVAPDDLPRVADVVPLAGWPDDYLTDPRWGPALGRPPGLLDADVLNSERFRTCSFPAIALHASARGLARFYADLLPADGPVAALLGPDLHAAYVSPAATGHDGVLDREVTWTLGFQVDEEDLGMGGAGGCTAWWSLVGGYAAAYVTRGLGDQSRAEEIWESLQ